MDQLRTQLSLVLRQVGLLAGVALAIAAAACGDHAAAEERAVSAPAGEGGSHVSLDSALALFRAGVAPVADLESGAPSLDAIVSRLVSAIERSDTAALRDIVMSRAEFAYLYYPTSVFTRSPMKQEPGLAWFLHTQHGEKGVSRLMDRFGGRRLKLSNSCAPAKLEGENRLWFDCVQRIVDTAGDTTVTRLFGGVYERNGRFKVFSWSNDL
jgi:hypothetical protein